MTQLILFLCFNSETIKNNPKDFKYLVQNFYIRIFQLKIFFQNILAFSNYLLGNILKVECIHVSR